MPHQPEPDGTSNEKSGGSRTAPSCRWGQWLTATSAAAFLGVASLLTAGLLGASSPGAGAFAPVPATRISIATGAQTANPGTPSPQTGEFTATGTQTVKLGKYTTPWMQFTAAARVRATWEGELCSGTAKLGAPGTDLSASVALRSGSELYVQSTSEMSVASAVTKNPLSFPIIVTRGGVRAGSVGTTWFVWVADENTTYFVMLGGNDTVPSGSDGGLLFAALQSTTPCECDPAPPAASSTCCRVLTRTETFVKVTTRPSVAFDGPNDLAKDAALKAKVDAAKLRAKACGLRP